MRRTDKSLVGRYVNPETNKPVNVWVWRPPGAKGERVFFYKQGKPQWVNRADFNEMWREDTASRAYR